MAARRIARGAEVSAFPILVAVILIACSPPEGNIRKAVTSLDSVFSAKDDFSGVVLVALNGETFYHKAFGYKNFVTRDLLDTGSIFELASVSKPFTAMVIMMLATERKLSYDDSLSHFFPELPYPGITVRHLLTHTSGLPDYQQIMDEHWDKRKIAGNNDNIEYLIRYRPPRSFRPGEKFEYSNTGYMLLASIAERSSGMEFAAFSERRIFGPLGMTKTAIRSRQQKLALPDVAWGHLFVEAKNAYVAADSFPEFNYTIWLGNRKGPGRVSASAQDLLKWDQALYTERLVPVQYISEAFTPPVLADGSSSGYGFGWYVDRHPVHGKIVYHTGDNPGINTILIRYLDKKLTFIVLCNNAHRDFGAIVKEIQKIVLSTVE